MRFPHSLALAVLISISTLPTTASAAPGDVRGNYAEWPVVPVQEGSAHTTVDGLLSPVLAAPGQIGSMRFAHDEASDCALVVMGGSGSPQNVHDALLSGGKVGLNKLGAKTFGVIVCNWTQPNGARVVVSNKSNLKQAVRGMGAVRPGALFAVRMDRPGIMGHISLSNSHGTNGARYYSDEYELVIATETDGMLYLLMIDKIQNTLIVVSRNGIWHGEWNGATRIAFSETMGPTLAGVGRVIVSNK